MLYDESSQMFYQWTRITNGHEFVRFVIGAYSQRFVAISHYLLVNTFKKSRVVVIALNMLTKTPIRSVSANPFTKLEVKK